MSDRDGLREGGIVEITTTDRTGVLAALHELRRLAAEPVLDVTTLALTATDNPTLQAAFLAGAR